MTSHSGWKALVQDAEDFVVPSGQVVARIHKPSALEFVRDYVATNTPCVISGLLDDWNALTTWQDEEYLCNKLGDKKVNVNVTPTGFGDAIHGCKFVKPEERSLSLREFFDSVKNHSPGNDVYYLSHQNNNLETDTPALFADICEYLPIAKQAFNNKPDAVNLWIGDEHATSTMHRDHYENMYAVVKGNKVFHLVPPMCTELLQLEEYPEARYSYDQTAERWDVELESPPSSVPWTPFVFGQPYPENFDIDKAAALERVVTEIHVAAGEVLYLPALWYHQVSQTELTYAVNFWHDMRFGDRWVYASAIDRDIESQRITP